MEITNLKKSFGEKTVVNLPALTVERGQVYVLWGRNGSGKSTFLRLLAGILLPDKGRIKNTMSVSYQPQNPYVFKLSCLESVLLGSQSRDIAKARELLDYFELSDSLDTGAHLLSGGQRQCMFLARSLLTDGELLLLDEPFSHIDAVRNDDIASFALEYCRRQGRALMVVVHKREQLKLFGQNRLIFSENGRIEAQCRN